MFVVIESVGPSVVATIEALSYELQREEVTLAEHRDTGGEQQRGPTPTPFRYLRECAKRQPSEISWLPHAALMSVRTATSTRRSFANASIARATSDRW